MTSCYGDWMGFKPESGNGGGSLLTPSNEVTAFYHVLAMKYMAELATAVGDAKAAAQRTAQHTAGQAAYHKRFFDAEAGGYMPCKTLLHCHGTSSQGSQTSNAVRSRMQLLRRASFSCIPG